MLAVRVLSMEPRLCGSRWTPTTWLVYMNGMYCCLALHGAEISSRGAGATDCSVLCTSWATTFCPAVCLSFTSKRAVILAVYQLRLYVTLKIFMELKNFQVGQGPPLSALICSFFSHRPGATTFSRVVGLCLRPGPSLAPVVCCALFFSSRPEATSFSPVMGLFQQHVQEQGPIWPLRYVQTTNNLFEKRIGLLCGASVVPVFRCAVIER